MSEPDQSSTTRWRAQFPITWPMLWILHILSPTVIPWLVFMYLVSR